MLIRLPDAVNWIRWGVEILGEIWSGAVGDLADGAAAFAELDGEFALRINRSAGEFFLVRDPLGLHPCYFRADRPELFSGFLSDLTRNYAAVPDPSGVQSCLRRDQRPAEGIYKSPLSGILTLAPGHVLHVKDGAIANVQRYWNPGGRFRNHSIQQFRDLLVRAVEKRCPNSSRVAISLSGGLDSACIAAALEGSSRETVLISYRFKDFPEVDEGRYQEEIARHLKFQWQPFFESDLADRTPDFPEQVAATEMPLTDGLFALFRQSILSARALKAGVLLTGHWGDQVTCPVEGVLDRFFCGRVREGLSLLKEIRASLPSEDWRRHRSLLARAFLKRALRRTSGSQQNYFRRVLESRYHVNCLEWNFKIGRKFGIPIRFPFFDRDLVDFLFDAPPSLFFHGGMKGILRRSFADVLPASVIERVGKADFSDIHRALAGPEQGGRDLWSGMDDDAFRIWREKFSLNGM